ncbi:protein FAM13A [Diorhabda carinulata]|uniref:protein FAM13A n=1 Tax=Diorhabda carinulata TaxID=1163345 RepID=UPI0025A0DB69|nr:protein FAM13A [Diorhabda carinulata]
MKGPTRKEDVVTKLHDAKIGKQKRIINNAFVNKTSSLPTTYDEAKATCKARKRKERQESISSLCQERKVIRSNSEERPAQKKHVENNNNIRRVSSSEDFQCQRSNSADRIYNASSKKASDKSLTYEDYEHEKRRSNERFARPLTLKGKKHPTKRLKVKCFPRTKYKPEILPETKDHNKKSNYPQQEQDNSSGFLQLHIDERERSPSPTQELVSPVVDWSTLHEQVDCSEPLLSQTSRDRTETTEIMPVVASNRLLSSPRNSIIATHRIYLDPDVPKVTSNIENKPQNPLDERLYKIAKQINGIKKKIKKYENEFETKHGYRPSHAEKMTDKNIKKLYTDLSSLKRDQKQLADISNGSTLLPVEDRTKQLSVVNLQATINEMEKKLTSKREAANRSCNLEEMSSEQLVEEKVAVQKALLFLESIHGRPNTKADRDVVRPFYDRYRTLKRMISKLTSNNIGGNELATIHENETMNFVTPTSSSQSNDTESEKTVLPSTSTDSDTDSSAKDNIHSMSKEELIEQLRITTEERKELKRKIKEFELNVQLTTGKMIQKEDKAPMENFYVSYKKIKAKSRLLEALVGKMS